ncbi:hypothetical protein KAW18_03965 [candidate division WOR-3 bacterium]|nr:hypothetical protein [candidate division WOR-3 bacterium]
MTETLFPKTEEKLKGDEKYVKYLGYLTRYTHMTKFVSIMDFLFCEIFPIPWRNRCFLFYKDLGPQLYEDKEFTSSLYDEILCNLVLNLCIFVRENKLGPRWEMVLYYTNLIIKKKE